MTSELKAEPAPAPPGVARKVDRIWESFGSEDPYFGVLSDPRYLAPDLTAERRAEFLATGERHVENVFATARRFLDPAFAPARALDFGCGVGRLVLPLARTCERVTGVDIAPSMLKVAADNARRAGLDNIEFVLSDDQLSRVTGTYDLIHSYIVLQHLGVDRGLRVIRQLLGRVNTGGIAALHIMYMRRESPLRALAYRARRDVPGFHALMTRIRGDGVSHGRGLMMMNPTPLAPVFEALQRGGFGQVHIEFSDHGPDHSGFLGVFVFARRVVEPRGW